METKNSTKVIQFVQVTPEQLQESILRGVKDQLDVLKKEYQPREPDALLSRHEVAELLRVDISSVHNYSKRGILKRHSIGNRILYKRSEVLDSLIALDK